MEEETVILEGFICPMCKRNLNSVYQLQAHFEDVHRAEEKIGVQLKEFIGKAKRKILKKREDINYEEGYTPSQSHQSNSESFESGGTDPFTWSSELGATQSHIQLFKSIRGSIINHIVVETNKLVIRLEKLVCFYNTHPEKSKKKAYEKTVVPWAPDADVKFCPSCGRKFNLAVRRHHCRLCGSIICKDCSEFLSDELCEKVAKKSLSQRQGGEEEPGMRVCRNCKKMVLRVHQQNQEGFVKTDIVQLYEKLSNVKEQLYTDIPRYNAIAESLNSGEMDHDLNYATEFRGQVLKLFDLMDLISKKILTLGMKSEPLPPARFQNLQKKIRMYATNFMQDQMLQLQTLPTEDELVFLHEQRKLAISQRITQERKEALEVQRLEQERQEKKRIQQIKGHQRNTSWPSMAWAKGTDTMRMKVDHDRSIGSTGDESIGWKPQVIDQTKLGAEDNPLEQQITIISNFLEQAKKAGKIDEVKILQDNLQDLEKEMHLKKL
ncbi:rabenosyn-5-like [Antedon mediterranea]|uniref:rabenosyn-5-like n=1 Tax=Antedon mediterranea TaxID=105859 RepID=UPI003AF7DF45